MRRQRSGKEPELGPRRAWYKCHELRMDPDIASLQTLQEKAPWTHEGRREQVIQNCLAVSFEPNSLRERTRCAKTCIEHVPFQPHAIAAFVEDPFLGVKRSWALRLNLILIYGSRRTHESQSMMSHCVNTLAVKCIRQHRRR